MHPTKTRKQEPDYVHTSALTDGTRGASLRSTRVCTGYPPSGTHFSLGFKTGFWAQNQLSTCYTEMKLHEKRPSTGRTIPGTRAPPRSQLSSASVAAQRQKTVPILRHAIPYCRPQDHFGSTRSGFALQIPRHFRPRSALEHPLR